MKVYCTLLTSDSYVKGALVLCHRLREYGVKYPIVAIYSEDGISPENLSKLQKSFDELHPFKLIDNPDPSNLSLMSRPDLFSTLTKIAIWSLTEYEQVIYLDADTLPLRSTDELFSLDVPFAAAPELGFPDCFNSGFMVVRPSSTVYNALLKMAEEGRTFDGGDQGLLNLYFETDFHRLSFLYNIECSAVYHLYMPALKRLKDKWSVIHFIGQKKPWDWPEGVVSTDDTSAYGDLYRDLVGKWWETWKSISTKDV